MKFKAQPVHAGQPAPCCVNFDIVISSMMADLEALVHDALLLGQGLSVLLQGIQGPPHIHCGILLIQSGLPQLTHLQTDRPWSPAPVNIAWTGIVLAVLRHNTGRLTQQKQGLTLESRSI